MSSKQTYPKKKNKIITLGQSKNENLSMSSKKKKVLRGKARVMRLVYPYTKYDTFLLIHVFKTNLSNFFFF